MKQVPQDNYYHFKSCMVGTWCPGMDTSLLYIYKALNVSVHDDPNQSSCMGFCYHTGTLPWEANVAVNARNLALSEKSGKSCVCVCPTSYGNLRDVSHHLKSNPETMSKANSALKKIQMSYSGTSKVYHASEIIHLHRKKLSTIAADNGRSLRGLKLATHHGCHYTKIFHNELAAGITESPAVIDEIIRSLGGETVDYSERQLCCGMGFHHTLAGDEYSTAVALRKVSSIADSNPDAIVVQCPGCLLTLDYRQPSLSRRADRQFSIPVISINQLVALLLGADDVSVVGKHMHVVSLDPLIRKIKSAKTDYTESKVGSKDSGRSGLK